MHCDNDHYTTTIDADVDDCSICSTPLGTTTSLVEFGASFEDSLSVYAQQDQCG